MRKATGGEIGGNGLKCLLVTFLGKHLKIINFLKHRTECSKAKAFELKKVKISRSQKDPDFATYYLCVLTLIKPQFPHL